MNDPHVNSLIYSVEAVEGVYYLENCPAICRSNSEYCYMLENGTLTCTFIKHFSTEIEAKEFMSPILRAWEIHTGLTYGRKELRFVFNKSDIIDRNPTPPPPPGTLVVHEGGSESIVTIASTGRGTVGRSSYPMPPSDFMIDEDISMLWQRFETCQETKYRDILLLPTSYLFLTYLTYQAEKNAPIKGKHKYKCAARYYHISEPVLIKMSVLTTKRGLLSTARKIDNTHIFSQVSPSESIWLKACMLAIIRRLGENLCLPDPDLKAITMSDLPQL